MNDHCQSYVNVEWMRRKPSTEECALFYLDIPTYMLDLSERRFVTLPLTSTPEVLYENNTRQYRSKASNAFSKNVCAMRWVSWQHTQLLPHKRYHSTAFFWVIVKFLFVPAMVMPCTRCDVTKCEEGECWSRQLPPSCQCPPRPLQDLSSKIGPRNEPKCAALWYLIPCTGRSVYRVEFVKHFCDYVQSCIHC